MPASPEQLLALLEAPHWKTPGSTSRKTEGPSGRRTEGQAPLNLTVLDHIAEGRQVLDRARRLEGQGSLLSLREAQALRTSQAMKSEALMGETSSVRQHRCPACGCHSLLLRKELAYCVNRHCAPAGVQRRWQLRDLAFAGPGTARRIGRSTGTPRDLVDRLAVLAFFAPTGHPLSASALTRLAKTYDLPTWRLPSKPTALFYALSDVMTAHAVHMAGKKPAPCATGGARPACSGLADLFFGANDQNATRITQAKELCGGCPLKAVCLEQALALPAADQHGVAGGLTAGERRELLRSAA